MQIIVTSDVELWSWNRNFEYDVRNGVKKLIELAETEKIPITLFISLSDKGYNQQDYFKNIRALIKETKSKYIVFGIHTHCKNLPIKYPNISDNLNDYSPADITKVLKWYKKNIEKISGRKTQIHRAGGYHIPKLDILSQCFKKSGIKIDSSLLGREYSLPLKFMDIIELSPATNRKYSEKGIVWGPEQMSRKEMINFYEKAKKETDVLVINFHSFSVYGNLGLKARVWHKMPRVIRNIMKPLVKIIKKSAKQSDGRGVSENFRKLVWLIKLLKNNGASFTDFKGFLVNKVF